MHQRLKLYQLVSLSPSGAKHIGLSYPRFPSACFSPRGASHLLKSQRSCWTRPFDLSQSGKPYAHFELTIMRTIPLNFQPTKILNIVTRGFFILYFYHRTLKLLLFHPEDFSWPVSPSLSMHFGMLPAAAWNNCPLVYDAVIFLRYM